MHSPTETAETVQKVAWMESQARKDEGSPQAATIREGIDAILETRPGVIFAASDLLRQMDKAEANEAKAEAEAHAAAA